VKGFYLALEGGEGAGKTTVGAHLEGLLTATGASVLMLREPGSTDLGEQVRKLLLHSMEMSPWTETLLFAAQRAQLVAELVKPALAAGKVVITDRSLYSSLAYQGGARGLGIERVRVINETALGGVIPDLVIVLAVELITGLARQRDPDRIGRENEGFQERVAAAYRQLALAEPHRVVILDVDDDPEKVAHRVIQLMEQHRG
jgi:dTMP kinase